jgi:hypothetical protein
MDSWNIPSPVVLGTDGVGFLAGRQLDRNSFPIHVLVPRGAVASLAAISRNN